MGLVVNRKPRVTAPNGDVTISSRVLGSSAVGPQTNRVERDPFSVLTTTLKRGNPQPVPPPILRSQERCCRVPHRRLGKVRHPVRT